MNENLEEKARELAAQPYHIVITREELSDGKNVFFLSYLELPGCDAQGNTLDEAKAELDEVAYEYILGYLQDGVEIPVPYATSQTSGSGSTQVTNQSYPTVERASWESSSHLFAKIKEG